MCAIVFASTDRPAVVEWRIEIASRRSCSSPCALGKLYLSALFHHNSLSPHTHISTILMQLLGQLAS